MNGCIRDSAELGKINLGVLALDSIPRKSEKKNVGERNVSVSFGGVDWVPGHFVVADSDGVVVGDFDITLPPPPPKAKL